MARMLRRAAALAGAMAMIAAPARAAGGQVLIDDAFTGASTVSSIRPVTNTTGLPCLTAGKTAQSTSTTPLPGCGPTAQAIPDAGADALRLTTNAQNQTAGVIFNTSVPTSAGLNISFDQWQWDTLANAQADGISFALVSAPPQPTVLGQPGGGLGYGLNGSAGTAGKPGIPSGWIGFGLDAYGSFGSDLQDGSGCTKPAWAATGSGTLPQEITVRGPGTATTGYCLLSSSFTLGANDPFKGASRIRMVTAPTREPSHTRVGITIDAAAGTYTVTAQQIGSAATTAKTATSGTLPTQYFDPTTHAKTTGLPKRITFVLAASTGDSADFHEVGNFKVSTIDAIFPELALSIGDNVKGHVDPGQAVTFALTAGVRGALDEGEPLHLTSPTPAGTTLTGPVGAAGWNCAASTATTIDCTSTNTGALHPGDNLAPITIPLKVDANIKPGAVITSTAAVVSNDAATAVNASHGVTVGGEPDPDPTPTATATAVATATVTSSATATPTPAQGVKPVTVTSKPPIATASATGTLLDCSHKNLLLLDVRPSGSKVAISGATRAGAAGQRVQLLQSGVKKAVATVAVGPAGLFNTTVKRPKRKNARYTAALGSLRSSALKLDRRMYATTLKRSGAKVKLAGQVTRKFKPGAKVQVRVRTTCTNERVVATTKLTKRGTWSATVPAEAGALSALAAYRATTTVLSGRKSVKTFTLPEPPRS